jgi:hypothetical protein
MCVFGDVETTRYFLNILLSQTTFRIMAAPIFERIPDLLNDGMCLCIPDTETRRSRQDILYGGSPALVTYMESQGPGIRVLRKGDHVVQGGQFPLPITGIDHTMIAHMVIGVGTEDIEHHTSV